MNKKRQTYSRFNCGNYLIIETNKTKDSYLILYENKFLGLLNKNNFKLINEKCLVKSFNELETNPSLIKDFKVKSKNKNETKSYCCNETFMFGLTNDNVSLELEAINDFFNSVLRKAKKFDEIENVEIYLDLTKQER